jgi:hypothetical protein
MRWLLFVLVLANICHFVWAQSFFDRQSTSDTPVHVIGSVVSGGVASLQLLSEVKGLAAHQPPGREAVTSIERLEYGTRCWLVGPLPELVTAKQVLIRLGDQGVSAQLLSHIVEGELGYMLYLGPFAIAAEASARERQLQLAGYASAQVSAQDSGYVVEIGFYETQVLAAESRELLHAEGFAVELLERHRKIKQFALRVVLEQDQQVPDQFWQEMDGDFTKLQRQQNWCGPIASVG